MSRILNNGHFKRAGDMNFNSIQTKIAASAGICLIITIVAVISLSIYSALRTQDLITNKTSTLVTDLSLSKLKETASHNGVLISQRLDRGLVAARTLAESVVAAQQNDEKNKTNTVDREVFNNMLINVLKSNKDLNGTYRCWEPNSFDGMDSKCG